MLAQFRRLDSWFSRVASVHRLDLIWAAFRRFGFVLWMTRASFAIMFLTIALFLTDQVSDAMVQLSESEFWSGWIAFFATEAFWAFLISYGARTVLMFDFGMLRHMGTDTLVEHRAEQTNDAGPGKAEALADEARLARHKLRFHIIWWPRLYALLGPLGISAAQLRGHSTEASSLLLIATVSAATGVIVFAFMITRRRLGHLGKRMLGRGSARRRPTPPIQPILVRSAVRNRGVDPQIAKGGADTLDPSELVIFATFAGSVAVFGILLFFLATFVPARLLDFSPSPTLVFVLAATWLPFLLIAAFISHWRAFPLFVGILAVSLAANFFLPDHHAVALQPGAKPIDFDVAVAKWTAVNPVPRQPIIVATAGGGIRAAFWTATVLGALEDCTGQMAQRTFAISGVSGGAIGAATFAALRHETDKAPACDNGATYFNQSSRNLVGYRECGQAVLSHNFLSAPLIGLTHKDLLIDLFRTNAWLPAVYRRLGVTDRASDSARALQAAWTKHVKSVDETKKHGFEAAFLGDGPSADRTPWQPALIFNATSVQTGQRVVVSSLHFSPDMTDNGAVPIELHDLMGTPSLDVTLGDAALLSARFPLISPAGAIVTGETGDGSQALKTRLVDGGYFDNFGAVTAEDIFFRLADKDLRPIVVQISSDPSLQAKRQETAENMAARTAGWGAPLWAVLASRNARGLQAADALRRTAAEFLKPASDAPEPEQSNSLQSTDQANYFHFRLSDPRTAENKTGDLPRPVPLGWTLSHASQKALNDELTSPPNKREFIRLMRLLQGDPGTTCKADPAAFP